MLYYNYLDDKEFLKLLDNEKYVESRVKIEILDFTTEATITTIEGKITGGSLNLSGTSNMRRTGSISLVADMNGIEIAGITEPVLYHKITEVDNLISMNKKIRIYKGITNTLAAIDWYEEHDIIWFPLGLFVVKTGSSSRNAAGINISLNLLDKCALLNGDLGGVIPAATIFSESELYNEAGTERIVESVLIKDMIKHLVVDFGGESPENVIIEDIPDSIVKVIKWTGDKELYLITQEGQKRYTLNKPTSLTHLTFKYGQDIGYMNEPFVYPGKLECNAGEKVANLLDKIRNTLGNHEWFYDVWGRFHFQEKKNYLNSTPAKDILELNETDYLMGINPNLSSYTIDSLDMVTSISNSPQFLNIKNDFVVWGTRATAAGVKKPIRYHLAFDTKPTPSTEPREAIVYKDYRGLQAVVLLNDNNFVRETEDNPIGEIVTDDESKIFLKIKSDLDQSKYYLSLNRGEDLPAQFWAYDKELKVFRAYPNYKYCNLTPLDWRAELYFRCLEDANKSFSKNYYGAEMISEWPKIYDVEKKEYKEGKDLYEYWIDFIEGSDFDVKKIGRRTSIITDNNSNCLFPVEIPNYIIVEADGDVSKERQEANKKQQEVIQVDSKLFGNMSIGGGQNAAYDKVKELLNVHTQFNESISISIKPIYHLEPNTRITIVDEEMGIGGDYIVNTISLPLTHNGTSNLSCMKALSKTF